MLDWEKVVQNRELLLRVEELVDKVGNIYHNFPQEVCEELNQLTGNDWTGDNYIEYCAEYWETCWTLEEVVYALFHEGEFPDKIEEELFAWNIEQSIDNDEAVTLFYRLGKFRNDSEKNGKYEDINVKQLYMDLLDAFPKWNNDVDSWEDDDYETFMCSNKETYAYEKEIHIYAGYEQKFLNCTLTNMNETEKDTFVKIVQKYCNHIAAGKK